MKHRNIYIYDPEYQWQQLKKKEDETIMKCIVNAIVFGGGIFILLWILKIIDFGLNK